MRLRSEVSCFGCSDVGFSPAKVRDTSAPSFSTQRGNREGFVHVDTICDSRQPFVLNFWISYKWIELVPANIFVGCFTPQSTAASTPAVSGSPPASTSPGECPFLPVRECAPPNLLPPPP